MHGNTVFLGVCAILLHLPFYNFLSWCRPYWLIIKLTLTRLSGGWMTQIGWKYQELMRKYNIVLKLQIYTHIDTNLHKDSEKIGLVKIKIYRTYN